MKRSLRSGLATALAAVATAALAVMVAPAAHAATGTVTLNPATGVLGQSPTLVPSAPCSNGAAAYTYAYLSGGPNHWPADTNFWKAPAAIAQGNATNSTFFGFAADNALVIASGTYDVKFVCTDIDVTSELDVFTGQIQVTLAGATANPGDTYSVVDSRVAPTLSTPTANPASITAGGSVTFSSTIAAPSGGGTVQFKVDGADFGAAATVPALTAAGTAVTATGTIAAPGTKAVTAVFTPNAASSGTLKGATSAPLSFTVNGPSADTTITLAADKTAISTLEAVTLTATVANAGTPAGSTTGVPTGTVTFKSGTTVLGSAPATAGVASLVVSGSTLGVGSYPAITAQLDQPGAGFNASPVSSPVPAITVTAPSTLFNPAPSPQTIQTNVVAGTITVSGGVTAQSGNVTLGFPAINDGGVQKYALQLNAANTLLTNQGAAPTNGHNELYRLVVTDSTAGNTGYKVTGVVAGNFASGANIIDSSTLGWTPRVSAVCTAGQLPKAPTFGAGAGAVGTGYETTVTDPGVDCSQVPAVAGTAVIPGAPGTTDGLKTARTLYSTTPGHSTGTVSVTAGLQLDAPTTTKAGYYTTNLTLTALAN